MRRFFLFLAIAMIVLVVIALRGFDGMAERRAEEERLLEKGDRTLAKRNEASPKMSTPFGAKAPRGATDVLLELRLSRGEAAADLGGDLLFSLRGNRVFFVREGKGQVLWRRGVANDQLLQKCADFARASTTDGGIQILFANDGQAERRAATNEAAEALCEAVRAETKPWKPETFRLIVAVASGLSEEDLEARQPWPEGWTRRFEECAEPLSGEAALATLIRTAVAGNVQWVSERRFGEILGPDSDGRSHRLLRVEAPLP